MNANTPLPDPKKPDDMPDLPPTPQPPPIEEPDPDTLPDETPTPNPDEHDEPPLYV